MSGAELDAAPADGAAGAVGGARASRRDRRPAGRAQHKRNSRYKGSVSKRNRSNAGPRPRRAKRKRPPTLRLPGGREIPLDSRVQQGIYLSPGAGQLRPGLSFDGVDAIEEAESPCAREDSVESGDEASCPAAAAALKSDGDSEQEEELVPLSGVALELASADKRTLALYAAHLEETVCKLQEELNALKVSAASSSAAGPRATSSLSAQPCSTDAKT